MEVLQEHSVSDFLNKNEDILLKKEGEHNLILGLSDSLLKGTRESENPLFYTIVDNGDICGQAIRTNPDTPLILACMGNAAIEALVTKLKNDNINLKSVVGPIDNAERFSELWSSNSSIENHLGIYQLNKVIHPDYENGKMRLATRDEFQLVRSFSLGFIEDCFPTKENKEKEADEEAKRILGNQALYLWINKSGDIVSMAAKSRETKNGTTISWVYTPRKYRKNGYASKLVAALSQKILNEGKLFCNLYTDLLNPTSNAIYVSVGYKMIAESKHINFN